MATTSCPTRRPRASPSVRRLHGLADADDAQVGERITPDDPELVLRAVDEGGLPAIGAGHHVGGGDEVAVGRERDR